MPVGAITDAARLRSQQFSSLQPWLSRPMDTSAVSTEPTLAPAAQLVTPTTPTLAHASMPDKSGAQSELASSPPLTAGRAGQAKYFSPPPPSSMTPPPSTQVPQRNASLSPSAQVSDGPAPPARTPSPTSLLSSPPPTLTPALLRPTDSTTEPAYEIPSATRIQTASPAELRTLLQNSTSEVQKLRTAAAHYKLQHTLLSIETDEAAKRMAVEYDMARREVEVLQMADQVQRQRHPQSAMSPDGIQSEDGHGRLTTELKQRCLVLQSENDLLRRRHRRAKKAIMLRDGEAASLVEECQRLKKRIKENREHVNRLRRPGGLYDVSTPRQSDTLPATPQRSGGRIPGGARSAQVPSSRPGGEDTFAALLLADQVLSQENNSAPSTPTRSRPTKASHLGHNRGSHSLSSLQSTPRGSRPMTANSASLLPPVTFSNSSSQSATRMTQAPETKHRRRESRDSTISASDAEATPRSRFADTEVDDVVRESPASQMATNILRRASASNPDHGGAPASKTSGLLQTKLFGKVKKPGMDSVGSGSLGKRKAGRDEASADDDEESSAQKAKKLRAGEDVGLGIGGWRGSQT